MCAPPDNAQSHQFVDQAGDLVGDVAEVLAAKRGVHVAGQMLFEPAAHLRLHRHRLERADGGDGFGQKRRVGGPVLKLFIQAMAQNRGDNQR